MDEHNIKKIFLNFPVVQGTFMNHRVFSKAEKLGFIFLKVAQLIQESSVQTCHNVRVRSATQWTSSVHTLHMSKPR